jgi:lysylphosphatidylglycerol synthetase-like protein (DUF2156 family)
LAAAGYLLAALTAGYLAAFVFTFYADQLGGDARRSFMWIGFITATAVFLASAFPASCFIAYGEYNRIKRWWYYAVAGLVTGAIFSAMFLRDHKYPWPGPVLGVVAGLIYWLVSGRQAGNVGDASPRRLVGIVLAAGVALTLTGVVVLLSVWPRGR